MVEDRLPLLHGRAAGTASSQQPEHCVFRLRRSGVLVDRERRAVGAVHVDVELGRVDLVEVAVGPPDCVRAEVVCRVACRHDVAGHGHNADCRDGSVHRQRPGGQSEKFGVRGDADLRIGEAHRLDVDVARGARDHQPGTTGVRDRRAGRRQRQGGREVHRDVEVDRAGAVHEERAIRGVDRHLVECGRAIHVESRRERAARGSAEGAGHPQGRDSGDRSSGEGHTLHDDVAACQDGQVARSRRPGRRCGGRDRQRTGARGRTGRAVRGQRVGAAVEGQVAAVDVDRAIDVQAAGRRDLQLLRAGDHHRAGAVRSDRLAVVVGSLQGRVRRRREVHERQPCGGGSIGTLPQAVCACTQDGHAHLGDRTSCTGRGDELVLDEVLGGRVEPDAADGDQACAGRLDLEEAVVADVRRIADLDQVARSEARLACDRHCRIARISETDREATSGHRRRRRRGQVVDRQATSLRDGRGVASVQEEVVVRDQNLFGDDRDRRAGEAQVPSDVDITAEGSGATYGERAIHLENASIADRHASGSVAASNGDVSADREGALHRHRRVEVGGLNDVQRALEVGERTGLAETDDTVLADGEQGNRRLRGVLQRVVAGGEPLDQPCEEERELCLVVDPCRDAGVQGEEGSVGVAANGRNRHVETSKARAHSGAGR